MAFSSTQYTDQAKSRSRSKVRRLTLVALTSIFATTIGIPTLFAAAGAADGCGTYSYGFTGTRLINDGISDVSGPYPIDLPSATYTVTLVAHDHHDTQFGIPTQPGEQYVVELNSGYTSPPSIDVPDDQTMTTTVFPAQKIAASTSITVRHGGMPGVNSVDVVCVGFTPEAEADPVVETPTIDPPAVSQPIETPTQDIGDPVSIVREPQITPPAVVEPEVKGTVETPPLTPQLAITGPSAFAQMLAAVGFVMIALGVVLVTRSNRPYPQPKR